MDTIQTNQKRVTTEQRNKYKPKTETKTTLSNQTRRQAGGFTCSFMFCFVHFDFGDRCVHLCATQGMIGGRFGMFGTSG